MLVGPAIAKFAKFTDQTAFDEIELIAEDIVPVIPHEHEQGLSVPGVYITASAVMFCHDFIRRAAGHIWPEASGEDIESVGNRVDHRLHRSEQAKRDKHGKGVRDREAGGCIDRVLLSCQGVHRPQESGDRGIIRRFEARH